jgi:hypothetical protein
MLTGCQIRQKEGNKLLRLMRKGWEDNIKMILK